jgi:8-oxo-dGTP pyrophosphatase MutT (NUDIX family)
MHTVFINDQPLRFINTYDKRELESGKNGLLVSENDKRIDEVIEELENSKKHLEIYYMSENPDVDWKNFISYYTLIEAAGGLVQNKKGEYLTIFRLGKWDLPKGKIEYDESPEQAAVREVKEECGITGLSIVKELPLTFHSYSLKGKRKLKKTHWFLMKTDDDSKLIPQEEEHIEEARWMDEKTLSEKVLPNTYSSISEMLNTFFKWN